MRSSSSSNWGACSLAPNGLPQSSRWLFPEYDFARMEPEKYAPVVMERILERGSIAEVRWLLARYGTRRLAAWLRQYGYRALSPRTFEYWRWVLGVKRFHRPPWERGQKVRGNWQ